MAECKKILVVGGYGTVGRVVLSVGLAPGMTNLLASYGRQAHPDANN